MTNQMSNMVIDQWNKMYKLMGQYKFTITSDVSNEYKCGICKNILINAHQGICGCNFCYDCISQYMANGTINCPNNIEECKLESLSNIAPNYRMNKLISKLIVRCSNKMCSHECQLIEMENHLDSCLIKVVKCPFIDIGCEHDDIINDKLNDHMLSDIYNHNKILIDLIGNLRNEMRELKEKVEGNQLEIKMLKENDRIKSEIIESLKEEIKSIKQENEDLAQQMEIGDRNLWYKFDKVDIEMNNKCKKDELLKEFNEKFNLEMNARYCDMREEWNEKIKKMRIENNNLDIERSNKIDEYLSRRDCGILVWQIGKINEIQLMNSEYFYDKQNPYKMSVQLQFINNELNIWLNIESDTFDTSLKWPCRTDVIFHIFALNDEKISKRVTKSIKIDRPKVNSNKYCDPIKFSYYELANSNLFNINCKLKCFVKFN